MNSKSSRPSYGRLSLRGPRAHAIQLEWQMIESPAPHPRFRDFPFADPMPAPAPLPALRAEKRPLAA